MFVHVGSFLKRKVDFRTSADSPAAHRQPVGFIFPHPDIGAPQSHTGERQERGRQRELERERVRGGEREREREIMRE